MIIGIGCDIVQISRIGAILANHILAGKFLERIYHPNELKDMPKNRQARAGYLAKRFAAKEAYAKALGYGIGKFLKFRDIWVEKSSNGKPTLQCLNHRYKMHLSLADEVEYAIAYVIIEDL